MRSLREITTEIKKLWDPMSPYARPYFNAMLELESIEDRYMYDSGKSIVLYFLANAGGWRGEDAKRIKKELKEMCK